MSKGQIVHISGHGPKGFVATVHAHYADTLIVIGPNGARELIDVSRRRIDVI